jgi:hypothetical protein
VGAGWSLEELAMPDLDLIKQGEQECATGAGGQSLALDLPLTDDDEFVRPQDFLIASFAREEEKGDVSMNCPNESEH